MTSAVLIYVLVILPSSGDGFGNEVMDANYRRNLGEVTTEVFWKFL